jgi:hypothetical protein
MYLMYVDESGDCGLAGSPTRYFILTGVVVHELRWRACLEEFLAFRKHMRDKHGLRMRDEIHAAAFITRPGQLLYLKRHVRLAILREFADQIGRMDGVNIINVVIDKAGKRPAYNVFEMAWKVLLQRFENTLSRHNFTGPQNPDERGMIFPDHTDDLKLQRLLRRMRRLNPIPERIEYGLGYRNLLVNNIIEDPSFRRSEHSYFILAADVVAYLLYQHIAPNGYMRKMSGHNYFRRLENVLCRVASSSDPLGIVRL